MILIQAHIMLLCTQVYQDRSNTSHPAMSKGRRISWLRSSPYFMHKSHKTRCINKLPSMPMTLC